MAKMETTLTKEEFGKQIDDFFDKLNVTMANTQKALRTQQKKIRENAETELQKISKDFNLNFNELKDAMESYLGKEFNDNTAGKKIGSQTAMERLTDELNDSTDNTECQKELKEWSQKLESGTKTLLKSCYKKADIMEGFFEKTLHRLYKEDSELDNCFNAHPKKLLRTHYDPAVKIKITLATACFDSFKPANADDELKEAKELVLHNFDLLYEPKK